MLVVNTKENFLLKLHQNRVHFPAERNAFALDHEHGRRDVTCKPAILFVCGNKKKYLLEYWALDEKKNFYTVHINNHLNL